MAMRFEHEFTVPLPVEQAWPVLLDIERIAPCLPGAAVDKVEGDSFTGRMKMKIGPVTVTYQGDVAFEKVDEDTHTMTIRASGKEAKGPGTAGATVVARLHPQGRDTRVTVDTSFDVTGRPAQAGRGVLTEVGGKLIDKFEANLSRLLGEGPGAETAAGTTGVGDQSAPRKPGAADDVPALSESRGPGPARPADSDSADSTAPGAESPGAGSAFPGPAGSTGHGAKGPGGPESSTAAPGSAASGLGGPGGPEELNAPGGPATPARHLSAVPTPPGLIVNEKAESRQSHPAGTSRTSLSPDEEALNLLEVAGVPLLKRIGPVLAALSGLILITWLIRRALRH